MQKEMKQLRIAGLLIQSLNYSGFGTGEDCLLQKVRRNMT